jgi:hypothetical protein
MGRQRTVHAVGCNILKVVNASVCLSVCLSGGLWWAAQGGGFKELDETELEESRRRREKYKQGAADDDEYVISLSLTLSITCC